MTAPPVNGGTARRALVVAYCFPPHAAVGTLRTLRVVEQLAAQGCAVTVITPAPGAYVPGTPIDERLLERVPAGVRVVRTGTLPLLSIATAVVRRFLPARPQSATVATTPGAEAPVAARAAAAPGAAARLKVWFDQLTSLPDDEAGWLIPATLRGLVTVWREKPDVIYSSAPPWTGQVAAWAIATLTGRPWVADFRDPWARGPWRQGRLAAVARIIGGLERRAVNRADAIIFTSHAAAEEVASHYGAGVGARLHVVRNGCNVREFGDVTRRSPSGQFVLLHTGSLYGARNPAPLLSAIATLVERGALDRKTFRLRQIGPVALGGVDLRALVRERKIEDVVEFVPRMPRGDALKEIVSASALLLIQPSHPLSIPAKTFEYFAAQRPILALTDESETARIVRESRVGLVVSPTDEAALAEAVLSLVAMADNRAVLVPEHLFDGDARAREMVSVIAATAAAQRARPGPSVALAPRRAVAAETREESSRV